MNGLELAIKSNRVSIIRMNALHLANAKMAEIEAHNEGKNSFEMPPDTFLTDEDLIYRDFFGINGTVTFNIGTEKNPSTEDHGNVKVTVKVTWNVDNNNYGGNNGNNYEEITKDIWIAKTDSETSD